MSLSEANIFHAKQILKKFRAKKSAFIDNYRNFVQILCLVGETNEILVHFKQYGEHSKNSITNKSNVNANKTVDDETQPQHVNQAKQEEKALSANWKLIVWFQKSGKSIQDLCFDPNGSQLLVICYDNTLHIVPILWIINPECGLRTTTSQELENFYWPFRSDEITSFIVPFSGPHECSNSKTCPNNVNGKNANRQSTGEKSNSNTDDKYTPAQINEMVLSNSLYQTFFLPQSEVKVTDDAGDKVSLKTISEYDDVASVEEKSPDGCEKLQCLENNANIELSPSIDNTIEDAPTTPCPFPLSVVWWITSKIDEQNQQHRAIIGYSDGSICVVGLTPNCPFIANTAIGNKSGGIVKLVICRDPIVKSVSLLINSSAKEQWKLLLEQNSIGYIFPDDTQNSLIDSKAETSCQTETNLSSAKRKSSEEDWQIIIPVPMTSNDSTTTEKSNEPYGGIEDELDSLREEFVHLNLDTGIGSSSVLGQQPATAVVQAGGGIFPAARARLASLRDLGAKKIGALKLKLIENKIKSNERDRNRHHMTQLACMHIPSFLPEILTTPSGPYFIVQYLKGSHLLSALHTYSDTLSVHSMDISLIPLYIYKIPKDCSDILITSNVMFTKQTITQTETDKKNEGNKINAIGVIGCNSTALRIGEDSEFSKLSMLGLFSLPDEHIIDIHRIPFHPNYKDSEQYVDGVESGTDNETDPMTKNSVRTIQQPTITTQNYANQQQDERRGSLTDTDKFFDLDDRKVIEHEFPTIELDRCMVVTDHSLYLIEFKDHPHIIFLNLVKEGQWKACEEFCKVFNLNFNQCIEYAGDVLLKKKKTTQALLTYNVAKIPPVKTALKLAMFGQNGALMHLCAMALKTVYLLKSSHAKNHTIKYVLDNSLTCQVVDTKKSTIKSCSSRKAKNDLNCGTLCSDFSYDRDETPGDLQMSNSSQFHLSNLLLLTLTEKSIKDKQLMPLWNFLVTNKRYHTNMSSIVLSQSGLYSSAVILALNRGAHMDAFCSLVGVTNQVFGWYSEINDILNNLSDSIFMECIIYLQHISMDYFDCIQAKIDKINEKVLERLRNQLDPFAAIFRPVVSQLSSNFIESDTNDINKKLVEFCRHLIETFLIIIIKLYTLKCTEDNVSSGLSGIYVRHEENQFAIKIDNSSTISAGFSHCAAIVDGSCYIWGSNGVNCALNNNASSSVDFGAEASPKCLEFISNMGLEVHAVKCGKAHTLILTNNGLYVMGLNLLGQLGIGKHHVQALQPMHVHEFDGKNINLIEAGQYHNAVYADGQLYTWGWGIYGQLGHGNVFIEDRPKIVRFFKDKEVKQISLGQAHSLVLCSELNSHQTILYVFGCNLFGQLGTGQQSVDLSNRKFLKSSVPIAIDISGENIIEIHTKFFTNFVVTQNNKLYTWGASPQLIRLMNQTRKRARMAQKFEETKTIITNDSVDDSNKDAPTTGACNENFSNSGETKDRDREENFKNICYGSDGEQTLKKSKKTPENTNDDNQISLNGHDGDLSKKFKNGERESNADPLIISNTSSSANLEDRIKKFLKSKVSDKTTSDSTPQQVGSKSDSTEKVNSKQAEDLYVEDECTEHLLPMEVDTTDIVGNIIQVSSGLYHSALVTNASRLYTWGKNLEKQLGRESSRCDLAAPTHLELNDNIVCVECGADFTIILTDHFTVKAFGNNNFGQCGREMNLATDRNSIAGKLVRLRVSKRVVRLPDTSQCIDQPIDVPLPRPKIRMNFDAVRYLKSIPKFRSDFISREIFSFSHLMGARQNPSTDGENSLTPDTEDEMISKQNKSGTSSSVDVNENDNIVSSEFIQYCLFIFHGIYDPHKILELATLNEFKVRILMLNYYVKEAFALCLAASKSAISTNQCTSKRIESKMNEVDHNSSLDDFDPDQLSDYVIKLFEYFTKDANIVPIHRTDLKYLIHAIFMYFIINSLPLEPVESYFLSNIDHYLFGLAFVLYFNNNNTKLEQQVQQKYTHLFDGCSANNNVKQLYGVDVGVESSSGNVTNTGIDQHKQNDAINDELTLDFEVIFRNVSTSFKTIICQRLIEFDNDLN